MPHEGWRLRLVAGVGKMRAVPSAALQHASLPAKQIADMVKHTPDVPTLQTIWDDRVPTWWSWVRA
ncbi:hypothetical protein HaLaN_18212 [Haematococcus lacustris]|uniref:Uncharacterized protein n=1 Tax=Haematococcus lacustris TaxID=44745 RepID=A0A699ZN02_HAELA|nr:hypothetical protein HaLaN_18212 [Haematococcus lacustris]